MTQKISKNDKKNNKKYTKTKKSKNSQFAIKC